MDHLRIKPWSRNTFNQNYEIEIGFNCIASKEVYVVVVILYDLKT